MSFDEILQDLIDDPTGLSAVIFCDDEGEMVALKQSAHDKLALFDLKVLGATAAAWLHRACAIDASASRDVSLQLCGPDGCLLLQGLPEHYYLVAVSSKMGTCAAQRRALYRASLRVAADM